MLMGKRGIHFYILFFFGQLMYSLADPYTTICTCIKTFPARQAGLGKGPPPSTKDSRKPLDPWGIDSIYIPAASLFSGRFQL